jgi:hypothetical protein
MSRGRGASVDRQQALVAMGLPNAGMENWRPGSRSSKRRGRWADVQVAGDRRACNTATQRLDQDLVVPGSTLRHSRTRTVARAKYVSEKTCRLGGAFGASEIAERGRVVARGVDASVSG